VFSVSIPLLILWNVFYFLVSRENWILNVPPLILESPHTTLSTHSPLPSFYPTFATGGMPASNSWTAAAQTSCTDSCFMQFSWPRSQVG